MGMRPSGGSLAVLTAGALAFWAAGAPAAGASAAAGPAAAGPVCGPLARTAAPAPAILDGVTATSASDAWAVGSTTARRPQPVVAHWNGSNWTTVSSPVLQTPGVLSAVAKFPGGVWAVGASEQATGRPRPSHLVLRVTGSAARKVPTPRPRAGSLLGVAATSATNAWAVGYITAGPPLILHWNGTAWQRSALPRHARGRIDGVAAASAANAWAIDTRRQGSSRIWHWNGTRWRRVATPAITGQTYRLTSVAAISARNAWAAGLTSSSEATVILHWNGARWRRTPSPNVPDAEGDFLGAVSASSADDAWAVGGTIVSGKTLAEHWDGTSWRVVPTPFCGTLDGISILPSGRAWAVGGPGILRWNGTAWKSVPLT
jgi:hypothetical protein